MANEVFPFCSSKPGLLQAANGGTLFLDEVADLPLHMQVKLLRAIQEKAVRPVGSEKEVPVDVRILSASHRDLAALVAAERFRQDLYFRLDVINLAVPSLRERPEDIPELCAHVLARLAGQARSGMPKLSDDAVAVLKSHTFPGNVRELENVLERAMTLCEGNEIRASDLGLAGNIQQEGGQEAADRLTKDTDDLDAALESVERKTILNALEQSRWNKTAAAKLLGISFGALRYRMQKFRID